MNLYFRDSYGRRRLIGNPTDEQGANLLIKAFLSARHYKSYYTRVWTENNETWFDVGSHSEFFILSK